MWWWCDPWEDDWYYVGPGPDGIQGTDDDFYAIAWDPDMPTYNGDDEIVIGFGMALWYDENYEELTQQSAKRYRENYEPKVILDLGKGTEYEVDLRISPVVYVSQADNEFHPGWRVFFYRVGTVFRAGELRDIIGSGEHTFTFIVDDWEGVFNTDDLLALYKFLGILPPDAPNAFRFNLS